LQPRGVSLTGGAGMDRWTAAGTGEAT
jgi:hypothetical protein